MLKVKCRSTGAIYEYEIDREERFWIATEGDFVLRNILDYELLDSDTIETLKSTISEVKKMISDMNLEVVKLLKEKQEMADFLMDLYDDREMSSDLNSYGYYDKLVELINKHKMSVIS